MKTTKIVLVLLATFFFGNASYAQKGKAWAELDAMKAVMRQTFPPMLKNNDLAPARANAAQMVVVATNLKNSEKPKAFKKKEMNEIFDRISIQATELDNLVKNNASDEDVKIKLSELHGSFAEIAHHKKAPGGHQHGGNH